MKKIFALITLIIALVGCSTGGQILGPHPDLYLGWMGYDNQLVVIGKIVAVDKDENQVNNPDVKYSYVTISITEVLYSDFEFDEEEIRVLYSYDLDYELYHLSTPSNDYCDANSIESKVGLQCTVTDLEFYKDITYKTDPDTGRKYDYEIVKLDNISEANIIFYIRTDFQNFIKKHDDHRGYDFSEYEVKPDYTTYFSGETHLVVLDGKNWHYDESKNYREQTDETVVKRLSKLIAKIDRINEENRK